MHSLAGNFAKSPASLAVLDGAFWVLSRRSPIAVLAAIAFAASAMMVMHSPASADIVTTSCGATVSKTVRSRFNDENTVTSTAFVNVPQTGVAVAVPAGQTRCVTVRFSAVVSCSFASAIDHCYFRVTDNGDSSLFAPSAAVFSSNESSGAHSFEWATRLGQGSHTIRIQNAVNSGVSLNITSWTLAVEVSN